MRTDPYPPMNEYEMGIFAALTSLMEVVLAMGGDQDLLLQRFAHHEQAMQTAGKFNAAATLGVLRNAIEKSKGRGESDV